MVVVLEVAKPSGDPTLAAGKTHVSSFDGVACKACKIHRCNLRTMGDNARSSRLFWANRRFASPLFPISGPHPLVILQPLNVGLVLQRDAGSLPNNEAKYLDITIRLYPITPPRKGSQRRQRMQILFAKYQPASLGIVLHQYLKHPRVDLSLPRLIRGCSYQSACRDTPPPAPSFSSPLLVSLAPRRPSIGLSSCMSTPGYPYWSVYRDNRP